VTVHVFKGEVRLMKRITAKKKSGLVMALNLNKLLGQLRVLIQQSRQQVLHAVDVVQVHTC